MLGKDSLHGFLWYLDVINFSLLGLYRGSLISGLVAGVFLGVFLLLFQHSGISLDESLCRQPVIFSASSLYRTNFVLLSTKGSVLRGDELNLFNTVIHC